MSFNENIISEIKNRCNIVDIIGRIVPLKKSGSNYKGVCPFHNEKTPSFVVSEHKQIFTCFGCGATGDAIEFVKRYYNLDFPEAIQRLATEYGVELKIDTVQSRSKDIFYEINREAANFFYQNLTQKANKGYAYMKKRGFEPATLKKFGIGYADETWDSLYNHLQAKGYANAILKELGLISETKGKYYDKFRNRVMFPIMNTRGKVIGFGGRAIGNDMPKYLNSQETPVFLKKNNLYGLNLTKQDIGKEDCAILVEGYIDVISLWQAGVKNVAASLGTALTENQAHLLARYTKNVILSYDADDAGRAAALRGLDVLYQEGLRAKVLHVTDGKDPDEFIKKKGREAFIKLTNTALPYADYKIENIKRNYDVNTDEGRVNFFKEAVKMLKELTPVESDIYIKKISADMRISEGAIRAEFQKTEKPVQTSRKPIEEPALNEQVSMLEKYLLKLLLTHAEYYRKVAPYANVFSGSARNIFLAVKEIHHENEEINSKGIEEFLEDRDLKLVNEIKENILLAGMEEQIFQDCIKKIEIMDLKKREMELNMRLTLANEEDNIAQIKEIMEEISLIQRMISGQEVSQ